MNERRENETGIHRRNDGNRKAASGGPTEHQKSWEGRETKPDDRPFTETHENRSGKAGR
jgi:hypothetical protein